MNSFLENSHTIPFEDHISSKELTPSNNNKDKSNFGKVLNEKKESPSYFRLYFMKFWHYLGCCIYLTNQTVKPDPKKNYSLPILNFFKLLLTVIRAKEVFKFRTVYRSIKKLKSFHLQMIDDVAYIRKKGEEQKIKLSYFNNITIRIFLRRVRKIFKRCFRGFLSFRGFHYFFIL